MARLLPFVVSLLLAAGALAQDDGTGRAGLEPILTWGQADVLVAEHVNYNTRVEAPPLPPGLARRVAPAQFVITIENEVEEATAAIQAAVDIWSTHVVSTVPIKVHVRWVELAENILGSAAPRLIANFTAALDVNTWFPTALASALEGSDLNPDNPDLELQFNANFAHWYFGLDGNPPQDTFDFLTVVLHEIGHGLGFVGSMRVSNGTGHWGFAPSGQPEARWPIVYDRFAETDFQAESTSLLDTSQLPNPSVVLTQALTSQEVYFNGPVSVTANVESQLAEGLAVPAGGRPKLYAPQPWVAGSSYSHLTEERLDGEQIFYPPGSINSLMTPRLGATEVIRTPGPVTCGMFRDMGWVMGADCEALLPPDEIILEDPLVVAGPCPHPAVGGQTRIRVHVPEQQRVRVTMYDVMGRWVRFVFDGRILASNPLMADGRAMCPPAGIGFIDVDARGLASGMYFLHVRAEHAEHTARLVVVN